MKPPKRKRIVLAAEPGPPTETEAAIEAREDELFVEAVRRAKPGLTDEEARSLTRAARERPVRRVGRRADGAGDEYAECAPDMSWLGQLVGVLTPDEMRELEVDLQLRIGGHTHGYEPSLPPSEPTDAEPGSDEKIKVMRRRLRRGESLHHPLDRKWGIRPPAGLFGPGAADEED